MHWFSSPSALVMSHLGYKNCLYALTLVPPPSRLTSSIHILDPACAVLCIIFLSLCHRSLLYVSILISWYLLFARASYEDNSHLPSQLLGLTLASKKVENSKLTVHRGSWPLGPAKQVAPVSQCLVTVSWYQLSWVHPPIHALSNVPPDLLLAPFSCKADNCQRGRQQNRGQRILIITPALGWFSSWF